MSLTYSKSDSGIRTWQTIVLGFSVGVSTISRPLTNPVTYFTANALQTRHGENTFALQVHCDSLSRTQVPERADADRADVPSPARHRCTETLQRKRSSATRD